MWPVGGGSLNDGVNNVGMATSRAIKFALIGKEVVGQRGQTSTEIVVLTKPPKSYAVIRLAKAITRGAVTGTIERKHSSARAKRRRLIAWTKQSS
jgi:hypothetical protein